MILGKTTEEKRLKKLTSLQEQFKKDRNGYKCFAFLPKMITHDGRYIWLSFYKKWYPCDFYVYEVERKYLPWVNLRWRIKIWKEEDEIKKTN